MTLGLDASTTCCGWAITSGSIIVDCGFIDISKFDTNGEKSNYIISVIDKNENVSKISSINLEAALSGFSGPANRAVIIKLARFNAVFEYIMSEHYKMKVNLVGAMTARKQVLGKATIKGIKPKEYVEVSMAKMYDLSRWEVKNKKGNVDKRIEDVRDSIVISLYNPTLSALALVH